MIKSNTLYTFFITFFHSVCSSSNLVLQSQWIKSNCQGPPTNMILFKLKDTNAVYPSENNETWPPLFQFFTNDDPLTVCGYGKVDPIQCCRSSLNITESIYQSALASYLVDNIDSGGFLSSSVGTKYCQINSSDSNSLFGYEGILIQNGLCFNSIKCFNNSIEIYSDKDCQQRMFEKYSFESIPKAIQNSSIGNVILESFQIKQATTSIKWIDNVPDSLLIPDVYQLTGILHLIMLILSCIGLSIPVLFHSYRFYHCGTSKELFYLIPYASIFIYGITYFVYAFTVFDDSKVLESLYIQIFFSTQALGTLCLSIHSTFILFEVYNPSILYRYIGYIALFMIHFILKGSSYIEFWYQMNATHSSTPFGPFSVTVLDFIRLYWRPLRHIWLGIFFIYNFLPLIILLYSIITRKSGSLIQRFLKLMEIDYTLFLLLAIYILNLTLFTLSKLYIYIFVNALGQDRWVYLLLSSEVFIISIHCIIQCLFINHLNTINQNKRLFLSFMNDRNGNDNLADAVHSANYSMNFMMNQSSVMVHQEPNTAGYSDLGNSQIEGDTMTE
ncbi:hypothetical protein BC833DRAFT_608631 [Globomyces pollinis-pini]|nr:hypothetical protein BC833DRAFT_608631 [Globomyces pollinis-pini]